VAHVRYGFKSGHCNGSVECLLYSGGFNRSTQHPSSLTRCNGMHMEGQARTWFTPKQRAELWERWKSGQCVADVARAEEQERRLSDFALAPRRRAPASGVAVTHRSKICLYSRLELLRQLPIGPLIFSPQICNGHDLVGSEWASLLESGRLREINLPGGPA
jgi:hypothetical protein